ncbi:MAG: OsmC family protein [Gammaproteobacteria bacterium]|nr:OsmC family protein [Gammaproteobacteria bacterium]
MRATVEWQQRMAFIGYGSHRDLTIKFDAPAAVGGDDNGFRPKELMLQALCGCTAMDVISILHKMQQQPSRLIVSASASETNEHPKIYDEVHLQYQVSGAVDKEKMVKAVDLSQNRYCGVSAMFRQFAELTYEICYE